MKFLSIRELRTSTNKLKSLLAKNGNIIVTTNGKPVSLMLPVNEANMEETLSAVRQAEMLRLISSMQMQSVKNGTDKMTMAEIDAEIAAYRRERHAKERLAA
ncbi:MAG: type II toxin-antitoxin system Phd/YefM family antitoxin [Candidatus Margulisbacteria bacterium]|jgi:antitoxin (DNA-binding transcriptional repressor) of toxin-antitoxin stability system|nr:type II toxin-antitoxin system Phd/YefM family antitoxin [Candidatus Margulisiibacteriota bacterium]